MATLRETLLSKRKVAPVELGGTTAYVRVMSGAEFAAYCARIDALKDDPNRNTEAMVALVNLTACDEDGSRLFDDREIELTRGLSLDALQALMDAAVALNGVGEKKVPSPAASGSS